MIGRLAALGVLAATVTATPAIGTSPPHAERSSSVVTTLPAKPGYPENIAEHEGRLYVSTGAKLQPDAPGQAVPSEVEVIDERSGALVQRIVVSPPPGGGGALTGEAFDDAGRLYVSSPWGVVRFHPDDLRGSTVTLTADQVAGLVYSPRVPTLPACGGGQASPCAPVKESHGSLPNGMAFGPDGSLYLADSFQATIWRIPPGGGAAQPWFQDAAIDGPFGVNGLRLAPDERDLLFTVSIDWNGGGHLDRIPLLDPSPAHRVVLHHFGGSFPDDFALGRSGTIYVALAFADAVAALHPDGSETDFTGPAQSEPVPVPYDMPSAIAFAANGGRVFVTNHSEIAGLPRDFVVFDISVDDRRGKGI